jgi:hypothetical protein
VEKSCQSINPTLTIGPCACARRRRAHEGTGGRCRVYANSACPGPLPAPSQPPQALALPCTPPYQGAASRYHPPCLGVLPAPLAQTGLLGQEASLGEPPLAFSVDVPLAHAALHCGQSPCATSTVRMRRPASYEATSLKPDASSLAGPACLPPARSGDCGATLPAARRSASPYLLGASHPLPAKASHVLCRACSCPSCYPAPSSPPKMVCASS